MFKKTHFLRNSSAPGSEAARDKWFVQKSQIFENKFCPRQRSCAGQVVSSKKVKLLEKVLPQAAKLPRTSGFFKKSRLSGKCSAPGSEAAWDKWFLHKKNHFLPKVLPQAAKLPRTSGSFKKKSGKMFCIRQRSCPGQVASSKTKRFPGRSSAPGSEAARDKWLVQKKNRF